MAPSLFAAAFKSPRLGRTRSTSSEGTGGATPGVLEIPAEQQQKQQSSAPGGVPPLRLAGGERPVSAGEAPPTSPGTPRKTVALPPPTSSAHGAVLDEARARSCAHRGCPQQVRHFLGTWAVVSPVAQQQ